MIAILLTLLKLSVVALLLAVGMLSTRKEITYLWQRPRLLIRSLLAMYILVPLAAILFVTILPLAGGLKLAIFVLAISAGAPLLPKKLMGMGSDEYVLSLVVTASVLAIFTAPAWGAALGPLFGRETHLAPMTVALLIAKSFLLPLAVGMLIRRFFPDSSASIADKILTVAGSVLSVSALILLIANWQLLVQAVGAALLALAGLTLISLIIGHQMGGEELGERTALAVSCANPTSGFGYSGSSGCSRP